MPSDRVAFIGGKTRGRDHFPFSVWTAGDVPTDPNGFPVALSLDQACKWFWRVRTWRMQAVMTIGAPSESAGSYTATYTADMLVTIGPDINRESDLVRNSLSFDKSEFGSSAFVYKFTNDGVFDTGGAPNADGGGYIELDIFGISGGIDGPRILLNPDGSLSPKMYVQGGMNFSWYETPEDGHGGGNDFGFEGVNDHPGFLGNGFIDGVPFPMSTENNLADPGAPTLSVSITPVEFWPYRTRSGKPVYDTSTGVAIPGNGGPFA